MITFLIFYYIFSSVASSAIISPIGSDKCSTLINVTSTIAVSLLLGWYIFPVAIGRKLR